MNSFRSCSSPCAQWASLFAFYQKWVQHGSIVEDDTSTTINVDAFSSVAKDFFSAKVLANSNAYGIV